MDPYPRLAQAVALMKADLRAPMDLDALAAHASVSPQGLERLFHTHLKCSPSRYHLKLRLLQARRLLMRSAMPLEELATACGFVCLSHLDKAHRDYFGIPPQTPSPW